jgi:poly-gamma-glutamate synthesis protein (capsule biosynthesis protein)
VVAVHHTSDLHDLTPRRARRIVAGRTSLDVAGGSPRNALRDVVRDPGMLAVVPAAALRGQVRALSMDGVDPLRRPDAYPLRTPAREDPGPVVRVTVVGDVMLGRGVAAAAAGSGDPAPALRPTARRLAAADITVGNLENTLSRAGSPRQGDDSFAADPAVVPGLRDAGFDVLGLANNHAGDFGDRALVDTVRRLRAGGLATFGAGGTVRQAWRPAVVERDGVRFGFLGFNAIGETPAVARGRPGAVSVGMPPRTGPLDEVALRRFEREVRRLARTVDVVTVLPHWGTQYTNRPEPVQHLVARRLVAAGADVVVGGHPHWLQGARIVRGRPVFHSLGNFVFDMDFMRRTMEGAILELTFWGEELKGVELVPYVMDGRFAPRVVHGARAEAVLAPLRQTSGAAFGGPRRFTR